MLLGVTISNIEIANAETIYLGTGSPVYSGENGTTKNVTGTVTDKDKNGLADGDVFLREASDKYGDSTNTRDVNWYVTYTDTFASEYDKYFAGDASKINARRAAVEESLKGHGSEALGYKDSWVYGPSVSNFIGSTGVKPAGVVYESSADLLGDIAMNQGGLSNFAVGNAGVLTTFGGGFFDEAGQFKYGADDNITYTGNHSDVSKPEEKVGFTAVQSGVVAFTTGFTKDATTAGFNYINGTFAVLGELLGIYLNGTLLDPSQYFLSDDMISGGYNYAAEYNFEIDLSKFQDLLVNGNNNLSFMLLGVPLEFSGVDSHTYNDSMSFIHFSADIVQNTESIIGNPPPPPPPPSTPEPATMLIVGLGIAGLGLRKKLMSKKSA
jgi:hypothetical protein